MFYTVHETLTDIVSNVYLFYVSFAGLGLGAADLDYMTADNATSLNRRQSDVDVDEKYERMQAWSLFARLFNNQRLQYNSSRQFLINFTSTSSSWNFGTIIIINFLIRPEFIQSGFNNYRLLNHMTLCLVEC